MKTAVIIASAGFRNFHFDLLKAPEKVRFIGLFTEQDIVNMPESQLRRFHQVHVVPCGVKDPSPLLCPLVDLNAARSIIRGLLTETKREDLTVNTQFEYDVLLASQLRSEFGLQGPKYEDILPFRDKYLMKEKLVAKGVRVPKFGRYEPARFSRDPAAYFRHITAEVGLPFVLKPVDSAGADGVHKISSWSDFEALRGDFGRGYEYEEFIQGTMYSVNIISKDRKTVFGGVTEYLVNSFDVQAGKVNADINLIDHDPWVARMVRFAESALDALGWPDGASHLELFLTDQDELVFLEVAARFKGLAGLAAMERHYGIALTNLSFELETGIESRPYDQEQVYCFDGVLPKRGGVIERLIEPQAESEYKMTWKVRPGDVTDQTDSLQANAGTFLMWNKDYEALYRDFKRLAHYEPIVYRPRA
ncbi:ATP-grasp domain-containing protein [Archangium violaceum]|uniref:ATP-grasp domain-containing protein n=1 Tax=Archangium violaceum TaxID=83451 RepID=UPI00194E900E|nr:ATP-grasp domain-containing protein [Archangium violaceum]QRN95685.1 ATP-grasp domain-containing protein [Archangium violaceum]